MPFILILRAQRYYISFLNLKFKMYRFFEAQYFVFQDDLSAIRSIFFSCSKKKEEKGFTPELQVIGAMLQPFIFKRT
jgi:hypothetical protein